MKSFGHPLHLMFIHFPSALLPMDLACGCLYLYTKEPGFTYGSFYAMMGGVALGWIALIFGAIDLIPIFDKKPEAVKTALTHGGINGLVMLCYSVLAFLQFKNYPTLRSDGVVMLVVKAVLICFMIVGNYLGANLILKHKIAVRDE